MRLNSISTKLGLIFISFALLVLISVAVTSWSLAAQKLDAVVINLAGRQRMLVQQISRLASEIETTGNPALVDQLIESQQVFEQTLLALRAGGSAPYFSGQEIDLPPTRSPEILEKIGAVEQTWGSVQQHLAVITHSANDNLAFTQSMQEIRLSTNALVGQVDEVVQAYEKQASQRVNTLRLVQIGFLICAIGLLLLGFWAINHSFLKPMRALGDAAQHIGGGALETPVHVQGDLEINVLSSTLEETRHKLLSTQSELRAWGSTLEERVNQRTHELEALNTVSQDITSHLDVKHVLNSIVEKSRLLLNADVAFLCLLSEEQNMLRLQTNSGEWQAIANCATSAEESWVKQVITTDTAICTHSGSCQGECGIVAEPYRRSQLAAPLSINRRVIGALCVASQKQDFFSSEAASLLTRLANIASIAIENARLYAQLERSTMLEERHRIAADMHDGLAQTLSFLTITADQIKENFENGNIALAKQTLVRMNLGLDQASKDLRRAIASLHDEYPTQYTLQEQIQSLVQEMDDGRQQILWENSVKPPFLMNYQDAEQVLRVVREATINAQKYSKATHIQVCLQQVDGLASISIVDNGVGIDPQIISQVDDRPHFGIKIMQARAARLGGSLDIHSQPGQGTRVTLLWPIEGKNEYD